MSSKKNIILSGAAALVVAASILGVSIFSGVSLLPNTNTTSNRAPGTLSVLLTDPPHVPLGVTKVYIAYSNLQVHSEAGNQSGWTLLKSSGSIELLGTVNVGQTITSVKIAAGEYNLLRFNISSAQVTFNGKNYTAFVPTSALTVPIVGGIQVNASKPSATIINIQPTVYNIGSASNPEFIIKHWAKAFPVPYSEVTAEEEHEGTKVSLIGKAWWTDVQERYTSNAQITSATLTPSSLSVTVKNTGNQTTKLRLVVVTPLVTPLMGAEHDRPPAVLSGSAIFIVLPNETLVPMQKYILAAHQQGTEVGDIVTALTSGGYNLTVGASGTLGYKGTITLGFNVPVVVQPLQTGQSIVPGQQYLVSVLGDEALASQVVVAGQ
jgi:hypothetical protein